MTTSISSHAIVDLDSDNLDDIWEERFNAQAVLPGDDEDGDGKTNLEECLGGTDPFDPNSCHNVGDYRSADPTNAELTFNTVDGKIYQIQISQDNPTGPYANYGSPIHGTGAPVTVSLSSLTNSVLSGSANHEIWVNVGGTEIPDLTGGTNYPASPDGVTALSELRTPSNVDNSYGGRVSGFIKPPATGSYTFYIAARHAGEFHLSTDASPANLALVGSVDADGVDPENWTATTGQSGSVNLTGGASYYFEILHKHGSDEDHCAVGWEGPGLPAGIQVVDGVYLCPADYIEPSPVDKVIKYAFEEGSGTTAADSIGTNNEGTLAGGASWTAPDGGVIGGAIDLDGTNDQVEIDDSSEINSGGPWHARTVALWFKADNPSSPNKQVIYEEGGQARGFNIYLDSGQLYVGGWNNSENGWAATFHNTALTDTGWHHVILELNTTAGGTTVTANGFKAYLDGNEFGSGDGAPINNHTGDIAIGAKRQDTEYHDGDSQGDGDHFAGCVDEFCLWNRALAPAEIAGFSSVSPAPIGGERHFFRIAVGDGDQDGDTLSDYAEKLMAGELSFNPYKSTSTNSGSDDLTTVTNALGATSETVDVAAADPSAYEDPRSESQVLASLPAANAARDAGRFRVKRTGGLQPLNVSYSLTGVPVPDESAGPGDYSEEDSNGGALAGVINIGFGQLCADVVIDPVLDTQHEFPEHVRCTLVDEAAYDLGSQTFADVMIYDARDIPSQEILFVAASEPETGAIAPQGSAVVSGKMKGTKDFMSLNTIISAGFSSPQDDSHIHQANPGPAKGPIVYEITTIPGADSDPLLGEIGPDYPYPIEAANGKSSRSQIDGFFNQNGADPMYLNWHTVTNGGGELWAFFSEANGSIDPPIHPPMPGHTFLTGDALEREIYRFLNQATFGATDVEVQAIKSAIETERVGNPTYSRIEEFEKWIDAQLLLDQTYLLDYALAVKNQEWYLRDYFNPDDWWAEAEFPDTPTHPKDASIRIGPNGYPGQDNSNPPDGDFTDPEDYQPITQTYTVAPIPPIAPSNDANAPLSMPLPTTWPGIDRSNPDPFQWIPSADYPLSSSRRAWGEDNDNNDKDGGGNPLIARQRWTGTQWANNSYDRWAKRDFGRPNERNRFLVHWMMHANAHDQLRQKMGYALQQICVVANTLTVIQDRDLGMANYQDQLNRMAFGKYRDVIDWIMISPQMGHWLSSIKNQKAFDIDGDGEFDVYPDENLAREVMQLFTCGLFLLHPDGSLALDSNNGLPQSTYNNFHITELSRIITGHSYSRYNNGNNNTRHERFDQVLANNTFTRNDGNQRMDHTFLYPMKMFGEYHDTDPKTILGDFAVDNTSLLPDETAVGDADMKDALDWLAGIPGDGQPDFDQVNSHQSTAPFIARRLIQRFVSSNPSSAYVERVTEAFRDGYDGNQNGTPDAPNTGEGDLLSAIKAILLDHEARDPAAATQTFGLKKSPYEAYVHLIRGFDAHSQTPLKPLDGSEPATYQGNGDYNFGSNPYLYLQSYGYPASQIDNFRLNTHYRYNNTDTQLSMSPMNQPTVFNFYLPDYSPGGVIAASALVAPEMMLANDASVYRNINYLYQIAQNTAGESELDLINRDDAFMVTSGNANNNERIRIDQFDIANAIYPSPLPTDPDLATDRNGDGDFDDDESLADEILFDEIDRRLTGGLFKSLYPYDHSDDADTFDHDDNPATPNRVRGPNPREAIIDFMTDAYGTGSTNNIRDKFRFGLYLYVTSPDYLVRQ
ncbi:MAG: DUF1800 family protein [Verrucomicrobiota bacterium]